MKYGWWVTMREERILQDTGYDVIIASATVTLSETPE